MSSSTELTSQMTMIPDLVPILLFGEKFFGCEWLFTDVAYFRLAKFIHCIICEYLRLWIFLMIVIYHLEYSVNFSTKISATSSSPEAVYVTGSNFSPVTVDTR
jgi:hypothetical protein